MGNLLRNASQERPMGAIRAMARKHVAPMGRSRGDGLQRTPDWMTQASPGSRSARGNLAAAGASDGYSPCKGTPCSKNARPPSRSEEPKSELQSLMSISYDVFLLKKKTITIQY